jgi:hypothetical protein
LNRFQRLITDISRSALGRLALFVGLASGSPALAQREEPFFNPRFEEKKLEAAQTKKKIVVPSFTRHIKVMREICKAIAIDGRLEDYQRVAGAQPDFSIECPTCRPFFRIWFSSCQIGGVGTLRLSAPQEATPTPVATAVAPAAAAPMVETPEAAGEVGGAAPLSDEPTVAPPSVASPPHTTSTPETPASEAAPSDDQEEEIAEEGEEEGGEPTPLPHPTPRPIVPERDPNLVVLDLVSRLFQDLAEGEGAELTLMAVDLFVNELRNPEGKSTAALEYFDTLAEFMLAPFESIREELLRAQAAQKGESPTAEPEESVNEMFDF